MRRISLLGLSLLFAALPLSAATITWTNAAGGDWSLSRNWSPAQVPTSADDVVIDLAGTYSVNVNVAAAAASLSLGSAGGGSQTLLVSGGSLTLGGASSVTAGGKLQLLSGSLGGGGALTIESAMDWSGGTIGGAGPLTIGAAGVFVANGAADKYLNAKTIHSLGTFYWDAGRILFQNNSVLNNQGLMEIRCDSTITSTSVGGTIQNAGTLRKSTTTGTTTIVQHITLANSGTIDIATGALTPLAATLGAGTNIVGTGLLVNGGTVSVTGASTLNGTMTVAAGTLGGPSSLTVNGVLQWTGGALAGSGSIDVASGGIVAVTGPADHYLDARTIHNGGTVAWSGGRILFQNNGVVNNLAAGTFDIRTDSTITSTAVGGAIHNAGTIVKSAGAGTATVVTHIRLDNNAGTIHVPSGRLTFHNAALNDGTQITGSGYTVNGGTNTVTGTVTIVNSATFASGTVNGAGTLSVAGLLQWSGGAMAGSGTTQVQAGGAIHLSGTADKYLDVRTIDNRGTTSWADTGRVLFQNNALFLNQLGAVFDAQSDSSFTSTAIGGEFRNFGTYRKSGGTGATTIVLHIKVLNDGGTFDVATGNVTIDSTMTLAGTSTFSGAGTTRVTGAIVGTSVIDGTQLVLLGSLGGAGTITIAGSMRWSSGSMTTGGGITNVATGATLTLDGTADKFLDRRVLNNQGTVNWTGGRILFQNSSVFNNEAGALFDIAHDSSFTSTAVGGTFNNRGTFRKSGAAGTTTIVVHVKFNNFDAVVDIASGTLVVDSPMTMSGTNTFSGGGRARITGPLSGTTTLEGTFELAGGSISGSGIVTVNGTLIWSAGTMNGTGSTDITAGATLQVTGAADHVLDVRTIRNAGTTIWDGGRVLFQNNAQFFNGSGALFETRHDGSFSSTAVGGRFTNEGTFRKTTATGVTTVVVHIPITSTGGTFDIQSGTLTVDSTITLSNTTTFSGSGVTRVTGTFTGTGTIAGRVRLEGSISGTGTVTIAGTLDWISGTLGGNGTTAIAAGGVMNIDSTNDHALNVRQTLNSGTIAWKSGRVLFQNNAVVQNQTGGVFSVLVDSQFTSTAVGGSFQNGGTFTKATPGTVTMTHVAFTNAGQLEVQSGTLRFEKSFTQTAGTTLVNGRIESTTAVTIQGGVLAGTGTFAANVTNGGNVTPGTSPGTLTIQGNYTQTAGGTLTIEIVSATQHDQLAVTGAFNAGGTLQIVSPYDPGATETFPIVTYASHTGDFATRSGADLGNGKSYVTTYSPSALTLAVVDDNANLYVSQTDAPDPVNEGETLTYTIAITNGAATTATNVTLTDTLDSSVTFGSATTTHGTCDGTAPVVCTIGTLTAGEVATVTITATPSQGGTITNTVDVTQTEPDPNPANNTFSETTLVNGAPVAVDDEATTDEDVPVTIDVLANDSDPNQDPIGIVTFGSPEFGQVECQGANCSYEPNPGFHGTDSFSYTIADPGNASDTAVVTVTVNAVNDPPIAADDAVTTPEDTTAAFNVLANDGDPDGGTTLTLSDHTSAAQGTVACGPDGACTYTPFANANGADGFTYTLSDSDGGEDTATVALTILPVNDDPVASADTLNTTEGSAAVVNVLLNDDDVDGDTLQVVSSTNGAKGTVSCTPAGDCTYAPAAGESGTDTFTYVVGDGNDGSASGVVNVTIEAIQHPPIATPDSATTFDGAAVTIAVLDNDSDPDGDTLAIAGFTQPAHGSVSCGATNCTYVPAPGFSGSDAFTYTITDADGDTATAPVEITVVGTNEPPQAVDDAATAIDVIHVKVLANDSDPDGDTLTIVEHTSAETGQVSCSETLCTYWPKRGFRGSDTFQYTIADGHGGIATATVRITVERNDCPASVQLLAPLTPAPANGTLRWASDRADYYNVYFGRAGAGCEKRFARVTEPFVEYFGLTPGDAYEWRVEAVSTGCASVTSSCTAFVVDNPCDVVNAVLQPRAIAEATSGQTYAVTWEPAGVGVDYDIEESRSKDFVDVQARRVSEPTASFVHEAEDRADAYFYRVRGVTSCGHGAFSDPIRVVVTPHPPSIERHPKFNVPAGSRQVLVQSLFLPGDGATTQRFTISTDKPWLKALPESGLLPPNGMLVQLLADPTNLPHGTITGTVFITVAASASLGSPRADANTTFSIPVSINLVTPVLPVRNPDAPPANALIIPTLGHLGGPGSQWQSDVRITNTSDVTVKYDLTFEPSVADGRRKPQQTTIEVAPGTTTALDDIVRTWFGHGSLGEAAIGFLRIVPVHNVDVRTIASSRTFNVSPRGTLGQFIPAIPFASFAGKGAPPLSLQQIAQSSAYRTNFGIVEASGRAATAMVTVLDGAGNVLKEIPLALEGGESRQLNGLLAQHGLTLDDGRIEVRVLNGDGKVTAYASTIDNRSNDPLLVPATSLGAATGMRYVLPGVADLDAGGARWRTDLRIFNFAPAAQLATLVLRTDAGETVERTTVIAPGEVKAFDGVVRELFGTTRRGGAIHITTATASQLVVTGRTYNETAAGTFGLFAPAVTEADATGAGERTLHIPQVEESTRSRTNIGVVEVSGRPATIEVAAVLPDSKVTPSVQVSLGANEFRQFVGILRAMGLSDTYNVRVTVRVLEGEGRVAAYGAVIDAVTNDPTYVPAQ